MRNYNYTNLEEVSTRWNVNPLVLECWCSNKKIEALYKDEVWLININQPCPLQTFDEYIVYLLDKAVNEFNTQGATTIYYNDVYVYTDLTPQSYNAEDTIILTKNITKHTNIQELLQLCYSHYLFNFKKETGCYPIFLKKLTLKT